MTIVLDIRRVPASAVGCVDVEYSRCDGFCSTSSPLNSSMNGFANPSLRPIRVPGPLEPNTERPDRYKWLAPDQYHPRVVDGHDRRHDRADRDAGHLSRHSPRSTRQPSNSFYLFWMILGFLVVTSTLVVSLGRLGDLDGRVKITTLASRCSPSSRYCFS